MNAPDYPRRTLGRRGSGMTARVRPIGAATFTRRSESQLSND